MHRKFRRQFLGGIILFIEAICAISLFAQPSSLAGSAAEIRIVEAQNIVEISPAGATTWVLTRTNQILYPHDRLRTGPDSRVALRWSDESAVQFGPSTELEVLPPHEADALAGLHLVHGVISFFHRDKPGRIEVITRGAVAGIEGTEFVLAVDDSARTTVSVIDGKVRFANEQAALVLTNGEQATAEMGRPPARTAGFVVNNLLQWAFYYPAVLDPADLSLSSDEQQALADSLSAYNSGDLLAALTKYPVGRQPGSDAERVYYAALLLSVGDVDKTEATLNALSTNDPSSRPQRLAAALRELIAAVKHDTISAPAPQLASEFLANSYYEQSRGDQKNSLTLALQSAQQAAAKSPQFGFAQERVAELEFGFGHTSAAKEALEKSLAVAPRNAQALALQGFLLSAVGRTHEAIAAFDRALAVDSALGNAWLGRGLCRIHLGDNQGGREDLLIAAALEPQRAELRSYLGKAYGHVGDFSHARKELNLAEKLDPNDPTSFLYSALLNQENNRVNEAIRDLEKSEQLNNNRSVYRSQLLLDQDQAVRSANLAGMYRDAGMDDVAQREAARAVNYDYGNYSAHLFLANSYYQLTDPNLVNLRYETPTEAEFLLANLLAPVQAGPLSPTISQQEYSQLFEQNHVGVVSSTEYLSRGAWSESGSQYGTFDNFNYSFSGLYHFDPGQRPNEDITEQSISLNVKAQITPHDTAFLLLQYNKTSGGDLAQYYRQTTANSTYRFDERQEPILGIGYHHEWAPGVHTLVFGARLADNYGFTNQAQPTLVYFTHPDFVTSQSVFTKVEGLTMNQQFENKLEIYSGEVQQIFDQPAHNTILGARAQYGNFRTENLQDMPSDLATVFPDPPSPAADQATGSVFKRFAIYGYHQWEITDWLELIGGASYDRVTFPENFRTAPVSSAEETVDQVSPKAGLILRPAADTVVRFAFTRSLEGASLDQSFQLEPSQVAGFIQSFRSIIPESVAGANAGARFETYGVSLEQKFLRGTYFGLSGELLNSDDHRHDGAFNVDLSQGPVGVPSTLREHLDYSEQSLLLTVNQLLGDCWSLGGSYRLGRAELNDRFTDVPATVPLGFVDFQPKQSLSGVLNTVDLFAIYNHPCGFFAEGEALWYGQHNTGYGGTEPGDDFWQFNLFGGYRFPQRHAELTLGLLNLTGQNYRLNPLNVYNELPRERTLAVRLNVNF
ncbi:MAG TPA: TonB-dependent receptor [Verrucomicrobiae bacterium]|nr:TonB-dependent receptor [Verrucomicrobiae bacterium]